MEIRVLRKISGALASGLPSVCNHAAVPQHSHSLAVAAPTRPRLIAVKDFSMLFKKLGDRTRVGRHIRDSSAIGCIPLGTRILP